MDEPLLTRGGKIVRLLLIVSLVPLMFAIVSLGVILANAMEHLVAGRGGGIYWTAIALLALSFASLGFTLTRVVRSYRRSTDEASKRTHAAQTGPSNGVTVPPWALTVALLALGFACLVIGATLPAIFFSEDLKSAGLVDVVVFGTAFAALLYTAQAVMTRVRASRRSRS